MATKTSKPKTANSTGTATSSYPSYMTESQSASVIMDILKADQRETERRQEAEALAQCATMRARMKNARSKTLTGSLLEALGLGKPTKQGGRATTITVPSSSSKVIKPTHETV